MTATLSRSEFLRNAFRGWKSPLRPPWAQPESIFLSSCISCIDCVSACPEAIIVAGERGIPEVDFSKGECTFCGDCATSCEPKAIQLSLSNPPWDLKARILDRCLSKRGVTCRVCGDQCDPRAIKFELGLGGSADPVVDKDACTGCGACFAPCPVEAIEITHPPQFVEDSEFKLDSMTSVAGDNLL